MMIVQDNIPFLTHFNTKNQKFMSLHYPESPVIVVIINSSCRRSLW